MFCTKCGTPLPDNAKFCTGCGQKLGESTTQNSDSRVCSHCNHQLTDSNTLTVGNKIVCKFCGCEATAAPMGKSKKLEDLALSFNKNAETSALIERAFIFLEDKKWEEATFYFEKILDVEPKNAQAYLGKLLSELHISKQSELANSDFSFENNTNYEKILRFGDEKLISELKSANERIITQKEEKRVNSVYDFALHAMQNAKSEAEFLEAANHFESIANIKDAQQLAEQCRTNAENCRKDGIYYSAAEKSTNPTGLPTQDIALLKESISLFQSISDWRDSKEQITVCQNKIGELEIRLKNERIEAEKKKQKKKKLFTILAPIVSLLIVFTIVLTTVIIPNQELKNNLATFATAKVGSSIWFGSYEQDNNTMNGSELIEWTVLDKTDDWLFVISKRALDCHAYNDTDESTVTWKNCTLRSWLNNTFIDDAFTKKEQSIIMETPLQPDETTDKIFLLNSEEVVNYFKTSEERICKVTIALSKKDIETGSFEGKATCSWALRNADYSWGYTTTVSCGGIVNSLNPKTTSLSCIRPAMCIRISDSSENEPSFDIQPKTVKSTETTVEKATTNVTITNSASAQQSSPTVFSKFTHAKSSSTLEDISFDITYHYDASNVLDGSESTCWCEGVDGDGIGETLTIYSDTPQSFSYLTIHNGICKNENVFYKNNRVKKLLITTDDGNSFTFVLPESYEDHIIDIELGMTITTKSVTFEILDVYPGTDYDDTCITLIEVS